MSYQLEGRLLEVCDCNVLCPCWVGEDPDNGTCDAVVAYHIDKGTYFAKNRPAYVCYLAGSESVGLNLHRPCCC